VAGKPDQQWGLACVVGASLLVLTSLLFVPPGTLPYAPGEVVSDAALQHWPSAYYLRQSVYEYGKWPLWNHTWMLGQPFAANPLNKVWYPPQWLVLVVPPTIHINFMIYGHMALLALGMMRWARSAGYSLQAALFMTIGWGFNTKLLAHLGAGHLDIVYALAWAPWLLWAVRRLVDSPYFVSAMVLALTASMCALADVRMAFFLLLAAGVYGIVLLLRLPADVQKSRIVLLCGAACGVFLLLTAVQWMPLVALSPYLTRSALTPEQASAFSLNLRRMVLSMLFGDTLGEHEIITYFGYPVMALALVTVTRWKVVGRDKRSELIMWVGLAVVALLWSLGSYGPLYLPVVRVLPALAWLRVPPRAWIVFILAMVALAGRGLDVLLTRGILKRGMLAASAAVVAGTLWLGFTLVRLPFLPGQVKFAGAALAITGLSIALAAGQGFALKSYRSVLPAIGLLGSLVFAAQPVLTGVRFEDSYAQSSAILNGIDIAGCSRLYAPGFDVLGPPVAVNHALILNGVDPFQLATSAVLISEAAGIEREDYDILVPSLLEDGQRFAPDFDQLERLQVGAVVGLEELEDERYIRVGEVAGLNVYENPMVSSIRCGLNPNGFVASSFLVSDGDAQVVMAVPWLPGWNAEADGETLTVGKTEDGLLMINSQGYQPDQIVLSYRPITDMIGAVLSGLTVFGLAVGWFATSRPKKAVDGE